MENGMEIAIMGFILGSYRGSINIEPQKGTKTWFLVRKRAGTWFRPPTQVLGRGPEYCCLFGLSLRSDKSKGRVQGNCIRRAPGYRLLCSVLLARRALNP